MRIKFWIDVFCCLIPMPHTRRKLRRKLRMRLNNVDYFARHLTGRPIIIWLDHALGGGTEVYSYKQFHALREKYDIIRVQYFPGPDEYHITNPHVRGVLWTVRNLDAFTEFCHNASIAQIVVNNLVIYKDVPKILRWVADLKDTLSPTPNVSFRGHDFHCICPSFNLINCDGAYCDLSYSLGCEECWAHRQMSTRPADNRAYRAGVRSICDWRAAWGDFLANTADEVILFSPAIQKIFLRAYPNIGDKIQIIPHQVRQYPPVKIRPHNEINIAVLGNVSHQKGAPVITEMAQDIPSNTNIIVIGNMPNAPQNVHVHGRYSPDKLPRIMSRYNIDIVFIASIWPETFSYTTAEAMSMGMPIVCYDMGAPAERVRRYSRGYVLTDINPHQNLREIIEFVIKLRNTKND